MAVTREQILALETPEWPVTHEETGATLADFNGPMIYLNDKPWEKRRRSPMGKKMATECHNTRGGRSRACWGNLYDEGRKRSCITGRNWV